MFETCRTTVDGPAPHPPCESDGLSLQLRSTFGKDRAQRTILTEEFISIMTFTRLSNLTESHESYFILLSRYDCALIFSNSLAIYHNHSFSEQNHDSNTNFIAFSLIVYSTACI